MPVSFYMDHHVQAAITKALRAKGVDVLTAFEDHAQEFSDSALMDRAHQLGRTIFTRDNDFLQEAAARQKRGLAFSGVIYTHQLQVPISKCMTDLELIAKACSAEDMANVV